MNYPLFDKVKIFSVKGCFLLLLSGISSGCITQAEKKDAVKTSEEASPVVQFHESHEPKKKAAPFSDVVQVGNIYFLSGQIGMDHATRTVVEGGISAETEQALNNIKDVLEQHSLKLEHVVKATVILDDISNFAAFNEVYVAYMPHKPARTTFAVQALALGAKIEIEVVAVAPANTRHTK